MPRAPPPVLGMGGPPLRRYWQWQQQWQWQWQQQWQWQRQRQWQRATLAAGEGGHHHGAAGMRFWGLGGLLQMHVCGQQDGPVRV